MGESLQRVFNRMRLMVYALQNKPIEVMINPFTQETLSVGEEEFDVFPDVKLFCNVNLQRLGAEVTQMFGQFIPMLQGAIDVPQYVKLLMELSATPEAARRFEEILPMAPSPIPGSLANNQVQKSPKPVGSPG
jgi:hypothetical protein